MDLGRIRKVWDVEEGPIEEPVVVPAPAEPIVMSSEHAAEPVGDADLALADQSDRGS